jgi:hypothetical protein
MAVAGTLEPTAHERTLSGRGIYVFMAGLFAVVALVGFAPRSGAILAGDLPVPPPVIHIHAGLMVAWLALLLTQTLLMASGRPDTHRRLGLVALALGPCLIAGMIAATIWKFGDRFGHGAAGPAANMLLLQARAIIYFALFFLWGALVRKNHPETHKRMMVLATLVLVPAAITRMTWLPSQFPQTPDVMHLYMLLLLTPALVNDIVRRGRLHGAYIAGLVTLLPMLIATHVLWNSPWWREMAPKIMGMG